MRINSCIYSDIFVILLLICAGRVTHAGCDYSTCTGQFSLTSLNSALKLWKYEDLETICSTAPTFKSCLDGIACQPADGNNYVTYEKYIGIANGITYGCTDDAKTVLQKNETGVCLSSLPDKDLSKFCDPDDLINDDYLQKLSSAEACSFVNGYLQCWYRVVNGWCNRDVARVETTIFVEVFQQVAQAKSCTIDESYLNGATVTNASLKTVMRVTCLVLIGHFFQLKA